MTPAAASLCFGGAGGEAVVERSFFRVGIFRKTVVMGMVCRGVRLCLPLHDVWLHQPQAPRQKFRHVKRRNLRDRGGHLCHVDILLLDIVSMVVVAVAPSMPPPGRLQRYEGDPDDRQFVADVSAVPHCGDATLGRRRRRRRTRRGGKGQKPPAAEVRSEKRELPLVDNGRIIFFGCGGGVSRLRFCRLRCRLGATGGLRRRVVRRLRCRFPSVGDGLVPVRAQELHARLTLSV